MVRRLALAQPEVAFTLRLDGRDGYRVDAGPATCSGGAAPRLAAVMGRDFFANALEIDATREGMRLRG